MTADPWTRAKRKRQSVSEPRYFSDICMIDEAETDSHDDEILPENVTEYEDLEAELEHGELGRAK